MPKIVEKAKVGSKGSVVCYGSGSSAGSYFYRELIPGTKNYRTRKIEGANNIEEAVEQAFDIATQLASETANLRIVEGFIGVNQPSSKEPKHQRDVRTGNVINRKKRSILIAKAVDNWLAGEKEKVDAGLQDIKTFQTKKNHLRHMLLYFESIGVTYTIQIKPGVFKKWETFRAETTPLVRQRERVVINEFLVKYLATERYLEMDVAMDKTLLPTVKVKQTDRMANPAINPKDWETIKHYMWHHWRFNRDAFGNKFIEKGHERCDGLYGKTMYFYFVCLLHATGMSPEEAERLQWKQIESLENGKTFIHTIRSKTKQAREIEANIQPMLRKMIKFQKWYSNKLKTGPKKQQKYAFEITPTTYVFGRPNNYMERVSAAPHKRMWQEVRKNIEHMLVGHRFSDKPYTQYSLRASFIENHLRAGTDIFKIARMAGHNVNELMKSYERLAIRDYGQGISHTDNTPQVNLLA